MTGKLPRDHGPTALEDLPRGELSKLIGDGVRAARLRAKLTQADVAERIGIASEVYGRMERSDLLPSVQTLRKMSIALGVSTDELLGIQPQSVENVRWPPLAHEEPAELRLLVRRARALEPSTRRLIAMIAGALAKKGRE